MTTEEERSGSRPSSPFLQLNSSGALDSVPGLFDLGQLGLPASASEPDDLQSPQAGQHAGLPTRLASPCLSGASGLGDEHRSVRASPGFSHSEHGLGTAQPHQARPAQLPQQPQQLRVSHLVSEVVGPSDTASTGSASGSESTYSIGDPASPHLAFSAPALRRRSLNSPQLLSPLQGLQASLSRRASPGTASTPAARPGGRATVLRRADSAGGAGSSVELSREGAPPLGTSEQLGERNRSPRPLAAWMDRRHAASSDAASAPAPPSPQPPRQFIHSETAASATTDASATAASACSEPAASSSAAPVAPASQATAAAASGSHSPLRLPPQTADSGAVSPGRQLSWAVDDDSDCTRGGAPPMLRRGSSTGARGDRRGSTSVGVRAGGEQHVLCRICEMPFALSQLLAHTVECVREHERCVASGDVSWREREPLRLGDFTLLKPVASGAHGRVVLCRKRATGDLLALKITDVQAARKKTLWGQLQHEADILRRCADASPFVVGLLFSFRTSTTFFMGMEYCAGGDLGCLLSALGQVSEVVCRQYCAEVCLALRYLHQRGIIHRDIKPGNILIGADGHLKLADFGLSHAGILQLDPLLDPLQLPRYASTGVADDSAAGVVSATGAAPVSTGFATATDDDEPLAPEAATRRPFSVKQQQQPAGGAGGVGGAGRAGGIGGAGGSDAGGDAVGAAGSAAGGDAGGAESGDAGGAGAGGGSAPPVGAFGTPDYMAPELLLAQPYAAGIDWWAVGVIAFEMLAGLPPFHDTTPSGIFSKVLRGKIDWALLHAATSADDEPPSREALAFIEALLQPDPAARLSDTDVAGVPFFGGISWATVYNEPPAFRPELATQEDTSYFEEAYAKGTSSGLPFSREWQASLLHADSEAYPASCFSNVHLLAMRNLEIAAQSGHAAPRVSGSSAIASPGSTSPGRETAASGAQVSPERRGLESITPVQMRWLLREAQSPAASPGRGGDTYGGDVGRWAPHH